MSRPVRRDGMSVDDLMPYCRLHWARIREQLLTGTYIPQPVRRVDIPKPDGKGTRTLGIPTVRDRVVQAAIVNYRKFTSQDELGHFLLQQYKIRNPRDLASCEVCHR